MPGNRQPPSLASWTRRGEAPVPLGSSTVPSMEQDGLERHPVCTGLRLGGHPLWQRTDESLCSAPPTTVRLPDPSLLLPRSGQGQTS